MSIWHDPGVRVARELNWLAVRHRKTARKFAHAGQRGLAGAQDQVANDLFEAAAARLKAVRDARCRQMLDTMIHVGTFGLFMAVALLFFVLPLLVALLFDHWIPEAP